MMHDCIRRPGEPYSSPGLLMQGQSGSAWSEKSLTHSLLLILLLLERPYAMTTETPAAAEQDPKIKITVTEETTATYLVTPEWLETHGFPTDVAELNDFISNGDEYATKAENPLDDIALKLEADGENTISEYAVNERDLYISSAE